METTRKHRSPLPCQERLELDMGYGGIHYSFFKHRISERLLCLNRILPSNCHYVRMGRDGFANVQGNCGTPSCIQHMVFDHLKGLPITLTVRLLTHVHCKPTQFFFHAFTATMSYSLQTSFNSVMKDWAHKYNV